MTASPPLLELHGITKKYGALTANDSITMAVEQGEVVAMLGENGAGKSTLMKIVYGLVRADSGAVRVSGTTLDIRSPRDAMAAGIGMVTQEFSLVDTMTVAENIALSGIGYRRVDIREVRRRVMEAMERVGVAIEPDRLISTLSIGERQRVEIVKALFHDCKVLILDEPTAVLTPQDIRALFTTIERLRADGLGVLFVSHKLREVAEISQRVVVLRRGALVGDHRTSDVDATALAGLMMGTTTASPAVIDGAEDPILADTFPEGLVPEDLVTSDTSDSQSATRAVPVDRSAPALSVTGLSVVRLGRAVLDSIDLEVSAGEILGIAGISGNGQTDLMDVLSGVAQPTSGAIVVDGTDVAGMDVADRLKAGLGRLTEDRKGSVIPQMSVEYNLVMEDLPSVTRHGFLDRKAVRRHAEAMIEQFAIRARPTDPVATLSGGNIQKVLLARAMSRHPRVLIVAQPTRGLDIGSYGYVHTQLRALRNSGAGILLISEDLDELRGLCDRISVLFRGAILGTLSTAESSNERLGTMMTGEVVAA